MSAPYGQALLDRMVAFPEGSVSTDTLPNRSRKLKLPSPPCRYKMVSMSLGGQGLSGVSLAGEELFLLPEEQLAADMLLGQVLEEIAGLLNPGSHLEDCMSVVVGGRAERSTLVLLNLTLGRLFFAVGTTAVLLNMSGLFIGFRRSRPRPGTSMRPA